MALWRLFYGWVERTNYLFAGDRNYIYYDSYTQTLRVVAYNGFYVNNVPVG